LTAIGSRARFPCESDGELFLIWHVVPKEQVIHGTCPLLVIKQDDLEVAGEATQVIAYYLGGYN
jgi:hypothetical protein